MAEHGRGVITIEDDDVQRIVMRLHQDEDPLGFLETHDEITYGGVKAYTTRMLAGEVAVPENAPRIELDQVTTALLRHLGVDVDVVCAIEPVCNGVGLRNADDDRIAEITVTWTPANCSTDIHIVVYADPLTWTCPDLLRIPPLPHTILGLAEGLPLRRILTHPALDGLDLVVKRVEGRQLRIGPPEHAGAD